MVETLPAGSPARSAFKIDRFYGVDTSTAESYIGSGFSKYAINCSTDDGTLKNAKGFGFVQLPITDGGHETYAPPCRTYIGDLSFFSPQCGGEIKNYMVAVTRTGQVMFLDIETAHYEDWVNPAALDHVYLASNPSIVQYRQGEGDCLLVFSKNDGAIKFDADLKHSYLCASAPRAASACVHYERIFVCDIVNEPYNVRFSAPMDATDWTGGDAGYITVLSKLGRLVKIIPFGDSLYIFHAFGISRLNAYARETEFSIDQLWYSDSEITAKSIVDCGDSLMFTTRDGMFQFNGVTVRRVCRQLDGVWSKIHDHYRTSACFFDGRYMMTCCSDIMGQYNGEDMNTLISYNTERGTVDISVGNTVTAMGTVAYSGFKGVLFFHTSNGEIFRHAGAIGNSVWKSGASDFGHPDTVKKVTEIYLLASGEGKIYVDVTADGKTATYNVELNKELLVRKVLTDISGRVISVGVRKPDKGEFCIQSIYGRMNCLRDGG